MPSYPLKQPNGLFAVFTTVADGFTDVNLTAQEVLEYGSLEWGSDGAIIKLDGAVQDRFIWKPYPLNDGLGRWRECLKMIVIRNGLDHLAKVLADMGLPDADIPADVIQAAAVPAEVGGARDI